MSSGRMWTNSPGGFVMAALLFGSGCSNVCEQDSDCDADQVCFVKRCTNRSTGNPDPSTCGDFCQPGETRCKFLPLSQGVEKCEVGPDDCSVWTMDVECAETEYCGRDGTCAAGLALDQSCAPRVEPPCNSGLRCANAPGMPSVCRPACGTAAECGADEICGYGVCLPASACAGCARGDQRCSGTTPEVCRVADGECTEWVSGMACIGSDTCRNGACVGTVTEGMPCSAAANCVEGLVCVDETGVCSSTCTANDACGGQACRVTPGSKQQGICADAGGPPVDAVCTIEIESAQVEGDWDLLGDPAPDLFVVVSAPPFSFQTNEQSNTRMATWNMRSPEVDFLTLIGAEIALLDSDTIGLETVARWDLAGAFDFSTGEAWSVRFETSGAMLSAQVRCTF